MKPGRCKRIQLLIDPLETWLQDAHSNKLVYNAERFFLYYLVGNDLGWVWKHRLARFIAPILKEVKDEAR